jgi:drug/metabolite transporter (DMT)-like permease
VLQLLGMALAMTGVVLAAREEVVGELRPGRSAVLLALFAAIGFGPFFVGVDQAQQSAELLWVMLAARTPGFLLLLAACAVRRPRLPTDPAALGPIAAIGFFDLLANVLFVLAVGRGLLSVVGVLGALYPAVTVLLARGVLHERLTRTQDAGVLLTLAGVVALAAGA